LSRRQRSRNYKRRKAGILFGWESGYVPYGELKFILTEILQTKFGVIVCGSTEKASFISDIIRRPVYEVSDSFSPTSEMKDINTTVCLFHNEKTRESCPAWQCHVISNFMFSKVSGESEAELEWPLEILRPVSPPSVETRFSPANTLYQIENVVDADEEEEEEPNVIVPPKIIRGHFEFDTAGDNVSVFRSDETLSKEVICRSENDDGDLEPCNSVRAVEHQFQEMKIE
jgi:hypothetical protein